MKTDEESRPVQVFAGTAAQAQLLKSLLGNAEIEAYLKDEFTGIVTPFHSPGGTGAVKVFVSGADRERARLVVEEFEHNLTNDRPE